MQAAGDEDHCFAARYTAEQVLSDPALRHKFFKEFLHWEGRFACADIGLASTGLTVDGAHILEDGQFLLRDHSNPSKESLHLALLGLAVGMEGLPGAWLQVAIGNRQ